MECLRFALSAASFASAIPAPQDSSTASDTSSSHFPRAKATDLKRSVTEVKYITVKTKDWQGSDVRTVHYFPDRLGGTQSNYFEPAPINVTCWTRIKLVGLREHRRMIWVLKESMPSRSRDGLPSTVSWKRSMLRQTWVIFKES
jgi:hypothetical protein